jgi:hypothetical protein
MIEVGEKLPEATLNQFDGTVRQFNLEKAGQFEVSDAQTMLKQL